MPLIKGKSDKAFKHNVAVEMHAHPDQPKRNLAIAYAMKRKAQKHKMARGGYCAEGCDMEHEHMYADGGDVSPYSRMAEGVKKAFMGEEEAKGAEPSPPPEGKRADPDAMKKAFHMPGYADGGFIEEEEASGYEKMPEKLEGHEYPPPAKNLYVDAPEEDMVGKIMKHRYSKGGEVANDTGDGADADFKENQFDDLVLRDDMEGHYPGSQEHGDHQEDEDRHDMIRYIMKERKMKAKGMPRPA